MCYSALVEAAYYDYMRQFGADIDFRTFYERYVRRDESGRIIKLLRGMDRAFANPKSDLERDIAALIAKHDATETARLETEMFVLRKRLADAERKLASKPTKAAAERARIATAKLESTRARLADLKRSDAKPSDARIFPGVECPIMVWEHGRRVIKPMRYQCRPAGKPATYDRQYPGTYNARRDNLHGFWRAQFGVTHGVLVAQRFYENVRTPDGQNQILEFAPRSGEPMLIACLWSAWHDPTGKLPDLCSFAAITDEPEPEVAAAGHDRTIINLKPEHLDAWLSPNPSQLVTLQALFDDKRHPYYEHRIAA